jgi:prepilin-type N-terminal cleavage/methylation domain-containing protein
MHVLLAMSVTAGKVTTIRLPPMVSPSRNILRHESAAKRRAVGAFSLIELLSVMAIIGMLTAAVIPALNSIKSGGGVTSAAYDISSTLEQARAYAMANNTYVFVGLAEVSGTAAESGAQQSGSGRVVVAAAGSRDGTRSFGTGNANLVPLSKLRRFDNVHLANTVPNQDNSSRPSVADDYRAGNVAFVAERTFGWPLAGNSPTYTFSKIIQFDPRGTASVQSSARHLPQWMEIGLVPTKGDTIVQSANYAALLLDGVTGSVKIYRP